MGGESAVPSINTRRWILGVVFRTAAVASCDEVTDLIRIKTITQQLNTSWIISNNRLDHNKLNYRTMSDTMTILNVTDMLMDLLTNQKHGESLVVMQMDCGRMDIWQI
jgi:hypothetical protein